MSVWFGFVVCLLAGVGSLSLVGLLLYHGNHDVFFSWGLFLTAFGLSWIYAAYQRYLLIRKNKRESTNQQAMVKKKKHTADR